MYSSLSEGFSQSPQTILHSSHSQKLFSLTIFFLGAVLPLIPLFPIPTPYQQSEPQWYLVLSCVCLNSPSFTDIIVDFLHTPLPSPFDSFSHIKACLAASCCFSTSPITSAFTLWFIFDENLLSRLSATSHRCGALHPTAVHFHQPYIPCYPPLIFTPSQDISTFLSYCVKIYGSLFL